MEKYIILNKKIWFIIIIIISLISVFLKILAIDKFEFDKKIEYLESIGGKIHRNTLEMRDWLKSLRR